MQEALQLPLNAKVSMLVNGKGALYNTGLFVCLFSKTMKVNLNKETLVGEEQPGVSEELQQILQTFLEGNPQCVPFLGMFFSSFPVMRMIVYLEREVEPAMILKDSQGLVTQKTTPLQTCTCLSIHPQWDILLLQTPSPRALGRAAPFSNSSKDISRVSI